MLLQKCPYTHKCLVTMSCWQNFLSVTIVTQFPTHRAQTQHWVFLYIAHDHNSIHVQVHVYKVFSRNHVLRIYNLLEFTKGLINIRIFRLSAMYFVKNICRLYLVHQTSNNFVKDKPLCSNNDIGICYYGDKRLLTRHNKTFTALWYT